MIKVEGAEFINGVLASCDGTTHLTKQALKSGSNSEQPNEVIYLHFTLLALLIVIAIRYYPMRTDCTKAVLLKIKASHSQGGV